MKKTLALTALLASAVVVHAHANPLICPFNDKFDIRAPEQAVIKGFSTTGNLHAVKLSLTSFQLNCAHDRNIDPGNLYLQVGAQKENYCDLVIHNGPFEMNPRVTMVFCPSKLRYAGMEHVRGTYHYTLKFHR